MPRGFYAEFCLCGGSSEERGLLLLQKPHMSPWVLLVLPAAERAQGRDEAPQGGGGGRPPWLRAAEIGAATLTSWGLLSCCKDGLL